jgi:hypothetical protein
VELSPSPTEEDTMTWEEMKEEHRADDEALERLIERLRDDL